MTNANGKNLLQICFKVTYTNFSDILKQLHTEKNKFKKTSIINLAMEFIDRKSVWKR